MHKPKRLPFFARPIARWGFALMLVVGVAGAFAIGFGIGLQREVLPTVAGIPTQYPTYSLNTTPLVLPPQFTATPPLVISAATEEALQWTDITPPTGEPVLAFELGITAIPATSRLDCLDNLPAIVPRNSEWLVCVKITNTGNIKLPAGRVHDVQNYYGLSSSYPDLLPGQSYQMFTDYMIDHSQTFTFEFGIGATLHTPGEITRRVEWVVNVSDSEPIFTEEPLAPATTEMPSATEEPLEGTQGSTDQPRSQLPQEGTTLLNTGIPAFEARLTNLPAIIVFGADWCQPCLNQWETARAFAAAQGWQFIAVKVWNRSTPAPTVAADVIMDVDDRLARFLGGDYIPVTLVVDANRTIIMVYIGAMNLGDLEKKSAAWSIR